MTQSQDPIVPEQKEVLAGVAKSLNSTPEQVQSMLEAIERGETRAEYFGFTDEVLRSIETIALAYYRGQRYRDAQVVFEMIITLKDGAWAAAWRGLGACSQAQNRYSDAIGHFRQALLHDNDDVHSAVYLGECLCLAGQRQAGLTVLSEVLDKTAKPWPKEARHLQRAQAIVHAGGVALTKAAKTADNIEPKPAALDIDAVTDVAVADIIKGLTGQHQVQDPEVQALLDNPATRAQLEELAEAVRLGKISIRRIANFSQEQMDASYAVACQMFERGDMISAVQMAGWMLYIDGQDTRFYRLAGLCMQHLKFYALADYYYTLVNIWRQGGADAATLMYHGEVKLMMEERDQGLAMLQHGVKKAGSDPALHDIVKRGRALLKQLEPHSG